MSKSSSLHGLPIALNQQRLFFFFRGEASPRLPMVLENTKRTSLLFQEVCERLSKVFIAVEVAVEVMALKNDFIIVDEFDDSGSDI